MACTGSVGVTLTLTDGSVEEGYLLWNHFWLDDFYENGKLADDVREIEREPLDKGENRFDLWIKALNVRLRSGSIRQRKVRDLQFVKSLTAINFPYKRYVGIKGEEKTIDPGDLKSIARQPALALSVDTTGIDFLDREDVVILSSSMPTFWVSEEESVGGANYVVYGSSVSLPAMLEHVGAHWARGEISEVMVNGKKILGGYNGGGPPEKIREKEVRSAQEDLEVQFLDKCAEVRQKLDGIGIQCKIDGDSYAKCRKRKSQFIEEVFPSLGTKERLRSLGVITLAYSWD